MPINDKFSDLDVNSYNLSLEIDKIYQSKVALMYPVGDIKNDRDMYELLCNYKIVSDCYNDIKKNYMVYSPATYTLDGFKECIIHNFNVKSQMITSFCKDLILSDEAIEKFLPVLQEKMTILNFVYNIDAMIDTGKKINFAYIFQKIQNYYILYRNDITSSKDISIADKTYYNQHTINNLKFDQYFINKFLIYVEINVYKKILRSPQINNDTIIFNNVLNPKITLKQTIILNEAIDFFIKQAKDIFTVDFEDILSQLYALKEDIFLSLGLFDCNIVELKKIENMIDEVDKNIAKSHTIADFKENILFVKQNFPNIRKNDFINYIVNKLGVFLSENKDENYLSRVRYNNFLKEFNYNPSSYNEYEVEINRKFKLANDKNFENIEKLSRYYIIRKRSFDNVEVVN
jgi:hypothetical protein